MTRHWGTIALVSLISLLVWVFAEAESLRTSTLRLDVFIVAAPDSELLVIPNDPQGWRQRLDVQVEGSAAAIERVQSLASSPMRLPLGQFGLRLEPGEHAADWREILRALPEVRAARVSIRSVEPAQSRYAVEAVVAVEARIVVHAEGAELVGVPETTPATARIRLPQRLAPRANREVQVTALVPASTVDTLLRNQRETVGRVPLRLPPELALFAAAGEPVRIEPPNVQVALTVRSREDSLIRPSVPVDVQVSAIDAARFEVNVAEDSRFIKDVRVRGPSDLIEQVRRGEIPVKARVILSYEELERAASEADSSRDGTPSAGTLTKEAVFSQLPTPLKFEAENRFVRVSVRRREARDAGPDSRVPPDR